MQVTAIELAAKRFRSKGCEQGMRFRRFACPEHRSETARIGQSQCLPPVKHEVDMIVFLRRRLRCDDPQAPGHPQVNNQCALVEAEQQVLRPPLESAQGLSVQPGLESFGNGPAQPPLADHELPDRVADDVGRNPAPGGFHLWKFRHGSGVTYWARVGNRLPRRVREAEAVRRPVHRGSGTSHQDRGGRFPVPAHGP